jgi:hypothetical protein
MRKGGHAMARMKNPLIHLNDIKVRDKMLLLYIFSVIIPIIFTNFIFYSKISQSVGEREMQYIAQDMQKIKGDFKRIIDFNTFVYQIHKTLGYFVAQKLMEKAVKNKPQMRLHLWLMFFN